MDYTRSPRNNIFISEDTSKPLVSAALAKSTNTLSYRLVGKVGDFFYRFRIAGELVGYLWRRKLWWLISMVVTLLAFGLLMIFAQATAIAPFIYTLF